MTTTTPEAPEAPPANLAALTPGELRNRALAELERQLEDPRFHTRYAAIVRCKATSREDVDDVLHTAAKIKHSKLEYGNKVALSLKCKGSDLERWLNARSHYAIQVREAPSAPDGKAVNLKLEGELHSVLLECHHLGRALAPSADGGEAAVISFSAYTGEDEEPPAGASLTVTCDGVFLLDRFELGQVYRLALLPAPKWLEVEDKRRREQEREDREAKKAAREKKAAARLAAKTGALPGQLGLVEPVGDEPPALRQREDGPPTLDDDAERVAALFQRAPAKKTPPADKTPPAKASAKAKPKR